MGTTRTRGAARPTPAPASTHTLPPGLAAAGWHLVANYERDPNEFKIIGPDGWETKTYFYFERALAEAQRRVISQPKADGAATQVDRSDWKREKDRDKAHRWHYQGSGQMLSACGRSAEQRSLVSHLGRFCEVCEAAEVTQPSSTPPPADVEAAQVEQDPVAAAIQTLEVRGFQCRSGADGIVEVSLRKAGQQRRDVKLDVRPDQLLAMAQVQRQAGQQSLFVEWTDQWVGQRWVRLWRGRAELTIEPVTLEDALIMLSDEACAAARKVQEQVAQEQAAAAARPPALPPVMQSRIAALGGSVVGSEWSADGARYVVSFGSSGEASSLRLDQLVETIRQREAEAEADAPGAAAEPPPASAGEVEQPAPQAQVERRAEPLDPALLARLEALGGHVQHSQWSPHGPHYAVYFGSDWRSTRLTRIDRLVRQIEQMETERAAAAAAEAPAPAPPAEAPEQAPVSTEDPTTGAIVPWLLVMGEQKNPWVLGKPQRWQALYHTAEMVRCREPEGKVVSKSQDKVWCVADHATWVRVEQAHWNFQAALSTVAAKLIALGSYVTRLQEAGGIKSAPNPLAPTVVASPDPDHRYGLTEVFEARVPRMTRHEVERHTPQMLKLARAGSPRGQGDTFPCPDDATWAQLQRLHSAAQEAQERWAALLDELGTYRAALADGRYSAPRTAQGAQQRQVEQETQPPQPPQPEPEAPAASPAPPLSSELLRRSNDDLRALLAEHAATIPLPISPSTRFTRPPGLPERLLVPRDLIVPGRCQPRRHFDEAQLAELAQSIREHGVLTALKAHINERGEIELIAGERRWRASAIAGLTEVPVELCEYTLKQIAEIALIDNMQRVQLSASEEGEVFEQMIVSYGYSENELSKRLGYSRGYISQRRSLAGAAPELLQALEDKAISFTLARSIIQGAGRNQAAQRRAVQNLLARPAWQSKATEEDAKNYGQEAILATAGETLHELGWSVRCLMTADNKALTLVFAPNARPQIVTAADITRILEQQVRPGNAPAAEPVELDADTQRIIRLRGLRLDGRSCTPWGLEVGKKIKILTAAEFKAVIDQAREEMVAVEARAKLKGWAIEWDEQGNGATLKKGKLSERASSWGALTALVKQLEEGKSQSSSSSDSTTCKRCQRKVAYNLTRYQDYLADGKVQRGSLCVACRDAAEEEIQQERRRIQAGMQTDLAWVEQAPRAVLELILQGAPVEILGTERYEEEKRWPKVRSASTADLQQLLTEAIVEFALRLRRSGLMEAPVAAPDDLAQDNPAPAEPPAAAGDDAALSALRARLDVILITVEQFDESDAPGPESVTVLSGCLDELSSVETALAHLPGGDDLRELATALRRQLELLGGGAAGPALDLDFVAGRLADHRQWYEQTYGAPLSNVEQHRHEVGEIVESLESAQQHEETDQDRLSSLLEQALGLLSDLEDWIEASA